MKDKHYVEGGPACDWIWRGTKDDGSFCAHVNLHLFPQYKHRDDCRGCHGTGLQAVEDWPDKVKAEWIWDNGYAWKPDRIRHDGKWVYFIFYQTFKEREPLKHTENTDSFSAALTAAIVAVAEEAERDSGK